MNGRFRINNGIVLAEAAAAGHGIRMAPSFYVPPKVRAFVDFLARRFGRKPEWERFP